MHVKNKQGEQLSYKKPQQTAFLGTNSLQCVEAHAWDLGNVLKDQKGPYAPLSGRVLRLHWFPKPQCLFDKADPRLSSSVIQKNTVPC